MNNVNNINEILANIVKSPDNINNYDLNGLSLDDWTAIFKTNEEVKSVIPCSILNRQDIQAILVSHKHCRNFSEFKADILSSKSFILLCMHRYIHFTAKEIDQINEAFPNDKEILEYAFKSYNLKGVLRKKIKKCDIVEYAKSANYPNMIMGDFDLYRLPRRFRKDEDFIKQLCQLVPSSYPTVLLLKENYSNEFVLYMLDKIKQSSLIGWELQQSWNQLNPVQKNNKLIAEKFLSVLLEKYEKNSLVDIENFIGENKELLKDSYELKNFKPKPHVVNKFTSNMF